jgi:hypothetical protein
MSALLSQTHYPHAKELRVVRDNLSMHTPAADTVGELQALMCE